MAHSNSQLRILAQPQISYRERYNSELDARRNRAQRFIRADPNPYKHEYPAIEISWQCNRNKNLYLCVTLVTVPTERVPVVCVHPYTIDTSENVIKDIKRNTLYFPITEDDFNQGFKSLRITRTKLTQSELRTYGPLRVLTTDQLDVQRIDDPNDARKIIEMYQLCKSQLVFSLAELVYKNPLPIIYSATTVYSNIMTALSATTALNVDELSIKCVPQKGLWEGGDEILMVIPKLDRRRSFKVIFQYPTIDDLPVDFDFVDTKTISLITPPCPFQAHGHRTIQIPLVAIQGDEEIARVNFLYQSFASNPYEQSATMDTYIDDTLFDNSGSDYCVNY